MPDPVEPLSWTLSMPLLVVAAVAALLPLTSLLH
jgi:hypothetical protein